MQQYQQKVWELPCYLFHQGRNFRAYEFLGAHPYNRNGEKGICFRVWAPRAKKVSLVGDFNDWQPQATPMKQIQGQGIWEVCIADLPQYALYKYAVETDKGDILFKADPFAFYSETQGGTASKYYHPDEPYAWKDDSYLQWRRSRNPYASPMNIYEVHLGSWKQKKDGTAFTYREYADMLIPYAKSMGYTHLELLPVMEYPFDGSWGYQICGYYSVTARYGTPEDFRYFIDCAHQSGLGIILDWVPAHFPKDAHGLINFDGYPLYEDANPLRQEHRSWGTRVFDYGRPEVVSFLVSNAMFWLDQYHVDGLRVDAVAAMLYLDYDRKDGEWAPNQYGGKENLEAIHFLKTLNKEVLTAYPDALMIAEESTAWAMVTQPPENGGLGFNFKWDMGWMNDTLSYMQTDPYFRQYAHEKLTFPMMYAFSENYILPISHDEVVHGKRSLLDKMPGEYAQKFANDRAFAVYMMTRPGKKLMFMGAEFGQFKEWAYREGLDFLLLDFEMHRKLKDFYQELNLIYLKKPQLWENDQNWEGFQWVEANDRENNCCVYRRMDLQGNELLVAINFSPIKRENYRISLTGPEEYTCIINSDEERFGGTGVNAGTLLPQKQNKETYDVEVTLPPMGAIIWEKKKKCTKNRRKKI